MDHLSLVAGVATTLQYFEALFNPRGALIYNRSARHTETHLRPASGAERV